MTRRSSPQINFEPVFLLPSAPGRLCRVCPPRLSGGRFEQGGRAALAPKTRQKSRPSGVLTAGESPAPYHVAVASLLCVLPSTLVGLAWPANIRTPCAGLPRHFTREACAEALSEVVGRQYRVDQIRAFSKRNTGVTSTGIKRITFKSACSEDLTGSAQFQRECGVSRVEQLRVCF